MFRAAAKQNGHRRTRSRAPRWRCWPCASSPRAFRPIASSAPRYARHVRRLLGNLLLGDDLMAGSRGIHGHVWPVPASLYVPSREGPWVGTARSRGPSHTGHMVGAVQLARNSITVTVPTRELLQVQTR
jgi:hypothetical protein